MTDQIDKMFIQVNNSLYHAICRVLLVILHDAPDFFVLFHQYLVDVLPRCAVQFRNFITSAVPKGLLLPNPLSLELKVDLLPEIGIDPPSISDLEYSLPARLQQQLSAILVAQAEVDGKVFVDSNQHYGRMVPFIAQLSLKRYPSSFVGGDIFTSRALLLFKLSSANLNLESRYDLINVLVDQLRYPNRHTHFFSCLILALFIETDDRSLQEQITRYPVTFSFIFTLGSFLNA